MFGLTKLGFSAFQQTAIKCAYNASRGMIAMLTEAGLEPALLLLLTERLPINGLGHMVVGFRLNLPEPPLICFYRP